MITSSRSLRNAFAYFALCAGLALGVGPSQGWAHAHPCSHTHTQPFPNSLISCNEQGAACTQGGNAGTCKTIQYRNGTNCHCVKTGGGGGGGGGCMSTGVSYFSDQGDGPPTANSTFIYLAAGSAENFFEFNLGDTPVVSFDNKETAVEGTISLLYGSFVDPSNVPVTVEDISISIASVPGAGESFVTLHNDGTFPQVTYDHVNGRIDTVDDEGILVDITNNFGVATVPVYLEAEFDSFGATLFMQMNDSALMFFDGLEGGTTDAWSAVLGRGALAVRSWGSKLVGRD